MKKLLPLILLFSTVVHADALYDFKVGTKWTYAIDGSSETVTNFVEDKVTTKNGRTWFKLVEYGESFWVANSEHGQIEAFEHYNASLKSGALPKEYLVFKFPAQVGEVWNKTDVPTTYEGIVTLEVPAGKYDCHLYVIDMADGNFNKSCIAEGVGVVYSESVLNNGPKETARLIKIEYN